MIKEIKYKDTIISYDLQYKKVKNVNLRIKPDGEIFVSVNRHTSQKFIDNFILSKAELILKTLEKYKCLKVKDKVQYCSEEEIKDIILSLCEKVYPYYKARGVKYPEIKFRKMVSRWGSCNWVKGVLNFNINLMYAPFECVEYVVLHEFTHFLQPNHSSRFYSELEKVCPNWKLIRNNLKSINIRSN